MMKFEVLKISAKSGLKPNSCSCDKCKSMCRKTPCLGTPKDIEAIIDAGYGHHIYPTAWGAGLLEGVFPNIVEMFQPLYDEKKGACTFYENGKCILHDLGLKPTEGILSGHDAIEINDPKKWMTGLVAKEWGNPKNFQIIDRIESKIKNQSNILIMENNSETTQGTSEFNVQNLESVESRAFLNPIIAAETTDESLGIDAQGVVDRIRKLEKEKIREGMIRSFDESGNIGVHINQHDFVKVLEENFTYRELSFLVCTNFIRRVDQKHRKMSGNFDASNLIDSLIKRFEEHGRK